MEPSKKNFGLTPGCTTDELREDVDDLKRQNEDLDKRLASIERWQSFVFGAAAATGALVGVALTMVGMYIGMMGK